MRVVFAAEKPLEGELSLIAPDGSVAAKSSERLGGPPYFWFAEVARRRRGSGRPSSRATARRPSAAPSPAKSSCAPTSRRRRARRRGAFGLCAMPGAARPKTFIRPGSRSSSTRHSTPRCPGRRCTRCCATDRAISCSTISASAKTRRRWSFVPTAPTCRTSCAPISRSRWGCRSATRSARAAAPAGRRNATPGGTFSTRSRRRHRRHRSAAGRVRWPVRDVSPASRDSTRAAARRPGLLPTPPGPRQSHRGPPPRPPGLAAGFGHYLRCSVADGVHSGAGRTRASDDNTDYYPVPLNQDTLRPGTVYADPYGHILVIVRRVPQTDGAAGVILAVDGQPDGTVARKRYWRGNFLFAQDPALGGPGFKRFRPIVAQERRLAAAEQRRDRQASAVRRLFARSVEARGRSLLRPHGRRDVAGAARSVARDDGGDHVARRAGEGARDLGRERAQVPEQRARRSEHAGRRGDLRDQRRVGGFRDAVARSAAADRDRCGAQLPGSRRAAARALRDAEGQERRRGEGRIAARAGGGAFGAQVLVSAHRRLPVDARGQGRDRPRGRARDGLQRQRLRRAAVGRAGQERGGGDLQAACAGGAAREDDAVPRLVPRAAPAAAHAVKGMRVGYETARIRRALGRSSRLAACGARAAGRRG